MPMYTHTGDLLAHVHSGIIIHGCNAMGVMGSGFAAQVKEKWPKVFNEYSHKKRNYGLNVGEINFTRVEPMEDNMLMIVNAITQKDYGRDKDKVYVDYDGVARAFRRTSDLCREYGIGDMHFPMIGAGLANGDWGKIQEIIESSVNTGIRKHLWVLPESK